MNEQLPLDRHRTMMWARKIAYEEVCAFQMERVGTKVYGKFNKTCRRIIRRRILDRIIEDKKIEKRYGFISIGWLLMVAMAGVITWAIHRWLDIIYPKSSPSDKGVSYFDTPPSKTRKKKK